MSVVAIELSMPHIYIILETIAHMISIVLL
jgi:hypothetical protein